jgi:hypothetical protein
MTLIAVLGSPKADVPPPPETRIVFKRGAVQAEAHGKLTGIDDELRFVVRARAKQHMRIDTDAEGPTVIMVTFPNGEGEGEPGGVFDDVLPADGDYHISITEHRMGEEWQGSVTLQVHIE